MRTLLAGERATTQAARLAYWLKLEVQNGSGTWKDLGALVGRDYTIGGTWGENQDTAVGTASFRIARKRGTASLAPLMSLSSLNVDDTGAYAPLLDIGRFVRASTATIPAGTTPVSTDYREMFAGRIDELAWDNDPITISCSDLGAWLMDTQIEVIDRQYGTSPVGTALETVAQSIITDNPNGGPAVTLYTPTSPGYAVTNWAQGRVKVLEGIRQLALDSTGWDLRYRYDANHVTRLTLTDPQRNRVTVDGTIGPGEYRALRRLSLSIANVRNAGYLQYADAVTGVFGSVTSQSAGSITKYRRRYFELAQSPSITSAASAQTLLDAVVNDLSGAPAEQEADCFYLWFVQLYDRYTFSANGTHYDTDQTFSVVGYQHTVENGRGSTVLTCAARVVGAYAAWLRQIRGQPTNAPTVQSLVASIPDATHVEVTAKATAEAGSWRIAVSNAAMPTLATVRAAPVVVGQSVKASIAQAVVPGQRLYIAALAYTGTLGAGIESLLSTAEVLGVTVAPTPSLTVGVADGDETQTTVHAAVTAGTTAQGALTFTLVKKVGRGAPVTLASGAASALPIDVAVPRDMRLSVVLTLTVTDTLTGTFPANLTISDTGRDGARGAGSATASVSVDDARSSVGGIPTTGGRFHTQPIYDPSGALLLVDPAGRVVHGSMQYPNGLDDVGEPGVFKKTNANQRDGGGRGFNAIDVGNSVVAGSIDFVRSFLNKHLGNVPDDATSDRRSATANQKTGGDRGAAALDAGNVLVAGSADFTRAYPGKNLANIPDDATSDRRAATANEKTGGSRGFGVIDTGLLIVASAVDFTRAFLNKHLGNIADDVTSDRRAATLNQKTGGDRGAAAIDAGNVLVPGAADFSRAYLNKHLGNVPDDATSDRRAVNLNQQTGAGRGFNALDATNKLVTGVTGTATAADGVAGIESTKGSGTKSARGAGSATGRVSSDNARSGAFGGVPTSGAGFAATPLYDATGANLLLDPNAKQLGSALSMPGGTPVATTERGGNKGDVALDLSGNLQPAVQQYDTAGGTLNKRPLKGYQTGTCSDGQVVTFGQAFNAPPMVVFSRGNGTVTFQPDATKWSGGAFNSALSQREDVYAQGLTATGFTAHLKLRQVGGTTPSNVDFPAGNALTAAGQATQLAVGANAPSSSGHYNVRYSASVTTTSGKTGTSRTATIVVVINKRAGGPAGALTELNRQTYSVTDPDGSGPYTNSTSMQTFDVIATLGATDYLEVSIVSFTHSGALLGSDSCSVHGAVSAADGVGIFGLSFTYGAADSFALMTPDAGNTVKWEAYSVQ